jgi:hypothetical protein
MTLKDIQSSLLSDFAEVARLSGLSLPAVNLTIEVLPAPHRRPQKLALGKCAVYGFLYRGRCLKVGKVGPRSAARFCSQHYIPSSCASNLAKTILANRPVIAGLTDPSGAAVVSALTEDTVGAWIERATARFHVMCPEHLQGPALSLLEAHVQCRLNPLFEGVNPILKSQPGAPAISIAGSSEVEQLGNVYLAIQEMLGAPQLLNDTEREWIQSFAVAIDLLQVGGHLSERQTVVAMDIYSRFRERQTEF